MSSPGASFLEHAACFLELLKGDLELVEVHEVGDEQNCEQQWGEELHKLAAVVGWVVRTVAGSVVTVVLLPLAVVAVMLAMVAFLASPVSWLCLVLLHWGGKLVTLVDALWQGDSLLESVASVVAAEWSLALAQAPGAG